ncbi:hypothetical protein NKR23_g7726 [Pleurostoma richardsiae]|uniref:Uncharacterized protein n=1 Tax=Pleurostoma richardsiae TaxID=41990 RepID=A0AA38RSY5_9PEZI|nr:hypothetical protein NKR23_g7726 [Pleurostoma richardsiae]
MSARKKEPAEFVNEYLQLRGQDIAELHPAFSNVNELRSQYEAMDKYREFMDALHEYGELEGERLGFNPTSCSWSDMLKQLKIAQAAAAKSERAERGFFTRSRKKVTNVSRLLGVALAALPPELSSLQGGLSMVFDLTQRRESLRREILDVFEDIPAILVSACNKYKHFPKEKRLHDAIDDLKVTLFDTIPSLVEVIAPKTFSDKVANHFRGRKADDLLEAIRKSAKRVEACAGILRDDMAVETYLDTEEIDKTTKHIRVHVEQIHDLTSNVGQGVRSLNEHYEEFDSRMADLTQRQNCIIEQLNYALTSQHSLFRMLTDSVSTILFDQESSPQSPKHASTPGQLAALLQALGVRHGTDSHDLAVVLRQSEEFDSASKSVGAIILASIQFQNWLAGTGSDLIYIESHLDSSRFGKTSPISYFCGNMAPED